VKFVEGVRTDEVATIDPGLHPLLNLIDYPPFPNVNWGLDCEGGLPPSNIPSPAYLG
jgi:hypothetical protein